MKHNNTYDIVKDILIEFKDCRDSDKRLLWEFWKRSGLTTPEGTISYSNYLNATSSESITRARRKVQELHPELGSSEEVQKEKDKKEQSKGTFIYRDNVAIWSK